MADLKDNLFILQIKYAKVYKCIQTLFVEWVVSYVTHKEYVQIIADSYFNFCSLRQCN